MKHAIIVRRILVAFSFPILQLWLFVGSASAKLDCGPVTNKSDTLPRTIAIGTNPAGTGAHSLASGLAAVASKATPITAKVQPYNGPNTWMPLMENGEIEFGIINIIDSYMAASGTGNYKRAFPSIRVVQGGVFPFTTGVLVRDKSDIKQASDLKGKRIAWDYGGHTVTQTLLNSFLEVNGIKPSDMNHVRVSTVNDGVRGVAEGRADASFCAIGIGIIEEVNAMEPIRFLTIPNTDAAATSLSRIGASVVRSTPATGIRGDTYVIGYPLHLVSSTKVSEKTVATVVKAWWDNIPELQTIHPLFKRWTKENQVISNFTIPYHPGAVQFYKEAKVWTDKQEARTKEICR